MARSRIKYSIVYPSILLAFATIFIGIPTLSMANSLDDGTNISAEVNNSRFDVDISEISSSLFPEAKDTPSPARRIGARLLSAEELSREEQAARNRAKWSTLGKFGLCHDIDTVLDPNHPGLCLIPPPAAEQPGYEPPNIDFTMTMRQAIASRQFEPTGLFMQPHGDRLASRLPVLATNTITEQSFTIPVAGYQIPVYAKATSHNIDWGDGTTDKIKAAKLPRHPNAIAKHHYRPGTYTPSITTYWQVTWIHPISQAHITELRQATTTETWHPFDILEANPVLITDK